MAKRAWKDAGQVISPKIDTSGMHDWPFDSALPIDVVPIVLEARSSIPANHHSYLEFMYVDSGELTIELKKKVFVAGKGDLLIVSRNHEHRVYNAAGEEARVVGLFFEPEILRTSTDTGEEMTEYLNPFLIQDSILCPLVEAKTGVPKKAIRIIRQIEAELPADSTRRRLSARTYLRLLLVLLLNHFADFAGLREPLDQRERQADRLRPLFAYLDMHYAEEITVERASSVLNMSPSHFMSFFKKTTGQSFRTHLNRFRIAKAKSMLVWTDRPVADVGFETGFESPSYFTSAFRRIVGTTPSEYRKSAARGAGEAAGPV